MVPLQTKIPQALAKKIYTKAHQDVKLRRAMPVDIGVRKARDLDTISFEKKLIKLKKFIVIIVETSNYNEK